MSETMTPADEFRRQPTSGENWQENYVFHAWDAERSSGWYFHLGHIADEGLVDVRAMSILDGQVTSATLQSSGSDCFAAPGLDIDVVAPLERIKLRFTAQGAAGPAADGFFGGREGDVPFGFDVEMISEHPVVSWAPHDRIVGLDPRTGGVRYEQGARWRGRIWAGGREIEAEGLLVRDHSWGPRQWRRNSVGGFWLPMVFDGGRRFISGCLSIQDYTWRSFTVLAGPEGMVNVSYDNWVRINGSLIPRQFDRASVLRILDGRTERYDYEGRTHLAFTRHASFTDTTVKRGVADMYSAIRAPDGTLGFGTLQHMTRSDYVLEGFENPMPGREPAS